MKHLLDQKMRVWLGLTLLVLLLAFPVYAEQGIAIDPVSLNITFVHSIDPLNPPAVETRNLVITAKKDVTNITFTPLDLTSDDGQHVISQQAVVAGPLPGSMSNGTIVSIPVRFDSAKALSGHYTGQIWFSYSGATEPVKVPVTATQKDDWWWAFLVLLPGLGISFALFTYASDFKKKDEIQSALSVILDCVNKDLELTTTTYQMSGNNDGQNVHNPFLVRINTDIPQAQSKLNLDAISDAEKYLNDVKDSWDNWNANRPQFRTLFDRCEKLVARMNLLETRIRSDASDSSDEVVLIKKARDELQDKFSAVYHKDTGQELGKSIISNEKTCNSLLRVVEKLEELGDLCATKDTNSCPLCKTLPDVWNDLLLTDDPQKPDNLLKDAGTWIETVSKCADEKTQSIAGGMVRAPGLEPLEGGELPPAEIPKKGTASASRLLLYQWGTYAAALIFLFAYGMFQFYVANPTFGSANDYLNLGLWGLVAGASADAISKKFKVSAGIGSTP